MEKVLGLLEKGRGLEKAGSTSEAKSIYESATRELRVVLPSFANTSTYDVANEGALFYETKIVSSMGRFG